MKQQLLSLTPVKLQEVDNISMGVLPNGETFLSLQGVAKFCGLAPSSIIQLAQDWSSGDAQIRSRGQQLTELIKEWTESSIVPDSLYVELDSKNSITGVIHAVPEQIVMAITDYYAHYAPTTKQEAITNYRKAAKLGLRNYIYERLNYSEKDLIAQSWSLFQERVLNNECPKGYFTMFDEATTVIASLIRNNIAVDDSIMPDGSLGIHWAKYWKSENLSIRYGERIKIHHKYPESYRQLDPEVNAYPLSAISDFRLWFQNVYLPEKYPSYIKNKVKDGKITSEAMPILLTAVMPPEVSTKRLN
ncbi:MULTISPECIES: hypothetical protein [Enterobacter]|uniref:BstA-like C-terminal domain-containing protein n=2 Tax=Enterobacter asburiae TaxID=61645 RepID=A0ABC9UA26_ENTAS|nr:MULTISPECIES: hypothetical protein [Enterobacter]EHF5042160.1 hypothetical protein [Enterobacter asburiae]EKS6735019.1 hypothetical protein [Enterobacter asburiae]EMB8997037.1 hypothetical protein [Enterobacter asburiae]ESM32072.1 hypothetical protein L402_03092 [Enterobacter asburiae]MCK6899086.1 hypothetical protein [Enterobacter asburiae]